MKRLLLTLLLAIGGVFLTVSSADARHYCSQTGSYYYTARPVYQPPPVVVQRRSYYAPPRQAYCPPPRQVVRCYESYRPRSYHSRRVYRQPRSTFSMQFNFR